MRILIATTLILTLAALASLWAFRQKRHKLLLGASAVTLFLALTLVVGMVGFPRETCELMGGNLTGYDSGGCVNEWGGTTVPMLSG